VTSVTLKRGTHLKVTAITTATRPKPEIYRDDLKCRPCLALSRGDLSHPEEGNTLEGDSYHHSHQAQAWNIYRDDFKMSSLLGTK
jgi:hypothetical protein